MFTDYSYSKTTKTQIILLIMIPILAIVCVCKMMYDKKPIYVGDMKTNINISEKENNEGDDDE